MKFWRFLKIPSLGFAAVACAFRRGPRRRVVVAGVAAVVCVGACLLWPMDTDRFLSVRASGEVQDRSGRLLHAFLNDQQQWCFPRRLGEFPLKGREAGDQRSRGAREGEISPYLVAATLAAEDQRFAWHPGVDLVAMARAAWQNLRGGGVLSGASTLSMQVVKRPGAGGATVWGKVVQAWRAVRLEMRASKGEILEAYLNRAPYGMNLIGCEAASRRYFGKPAAELTVPEAALLAGLPKSPTRCMPLRNPTSALRRRNHVLGRMRAEGMLTGAQHQEAVRAPLGTQWHAYPALAPHLAMRLRPLARQQGRCVTTLDGGIQARAEVLARQAVRTGAPDIGNAALLVVDVAEGTVLAHVGSADFARISQVDATRAERSPGSALKPFTYALAMHRQVLYPGEMLLDGRLDYGLYAPENFDRSHHGLVAAGEALRRSLNVPAITVLERIGGADLQGFLRSLHFTTLRRTADHYGLGLTLGSCEVRLDELAAAYCALANLGSYRPLRRIGGAGGAGDDGFRADLRYPGARCLPADICLALYSMMEQPLPGMIRGAESARLDPRVCWKTGTSTGRHDAWAVVFNARYLVAAWMGNNDNRPSARLVGAETALPLAGNVFRMLPSSARPEWPSRGEGLRAVRVCSVSGLPASRWCGSAGAKQSEGVTGIAPMGGATHIEYLPRSQYLHRICDVHYPVAANRLDLGAVADLDSLGGQGVLGGRVSERWPPSARGWDLARIPAPAGGGLQERGLGEGVGNAEALRIETPANHAEILLTGGARGDQMRLASSLDNLTSVSWYLNGAHIGVSQPFQPLILRLAPGRHRIACMAPTGETAKAQFEVREPE